MYKFAVIFKITPLYFQRNDWSSEYLSKNKRALCWSIYLLISCYWCSDNQLVLLSCYWCYDDQLVLLSCYWCSDNQLVLLSCLWCSDNQLVLLSCYWCSSNQLFLAEVAESVVWGVLDSESGMDVVQVCRLKKDNTHKNSLFLRKWELFLGMLSKIYKLKQQQQNEVGNL